MPNTQLFTSEIIEGVNPGHSFQDLTHSVICDLDFGKLFPTLVLECIPGDVIQISNQTEIKFQPLHTPAFTRMYVSNHYFFSPLRHLDKNWEDFYTTGEDGDYKGALETVNIDSTTQFTRTHDLKIEALEDGAQIAGIHTNWDFFGLPVISGRAANLKDSFVNAYANTRAYLEKLRDNDLLPLIYPFKALMHIWDEYYRDEDLYERVWNYRDCKPRDGFALPLNPLPRAWMKDYFTSARPWRQKGTAPRVPVTLSGRIDVGLLGNPDLQGKRLLYPLIGSKNAGDADVRITTVGTQIHLSSNIVAQTTTEGLDPLVKPITGYFDMTDLRFVAQMQKYLELNARAGNRYTEYLRAQYGAFPSDARLNRPEYLGGTKEWVNITEVLQTSATQDDSPQANRAGTANMFSRQFAVDYHVEEPGYIICLTSVMIEPFYQNQINRMWTRRSNYDFYIPLFANMSEQPVFNYEVAAFDNPSGVFGYQGHANEYRTIDNRVCGAMRSYQGIPKDTQGTVNAFMDASYEGSNGTMKYQSLDFWHTARKFEEQPKLNSEFIECNPRTDMFAVDPSLEWPMIGCITHKIGAVRPMPSYSNPGRLDHMR